MIKTFKCKETEKIFGREYSRKLPRDIQKAAFRKLRMIGRSKTLSDWKSRRLTGWKNYPVKEKDNIAFALMINGGFVLSG